MRARIFNPDADHRPVSVFSTLADFFCRWYLPAIRSDRRRRPVSDATILRRRAAIDWWTLLTATETAPEGPVLCEINQDHLDQVRERLAYCKYTRRGDPADRKIYDPDGTAEGKPLTRVTQKRTLDEILIVINATGPTNGRKIRAGLLDDPPAIYVPEANYFPRPTWTMAEAQAIAHAAATGQPPARWKYSSGSWNALSRATVAWWFYTGHRASSYEILTRGDVSEPKPGLFCVDVLQSVKTGKTDRIPVHPQLLSSLRDVWAEFPDDRRLIPWPVKYHRVTAYAERWQQQAGLDPSRIFSPQAWRRLHSEQIEQAAFKTAQRMASASLGHASADTTASHYLLSAVRLQLPDLFSRQKTLF